jgi:hypothetical protein
VQVNRRTLTLNAQTLARQISEMESKLQHRIVAEREGKLVQMTKALAEKTGPGGPRPQPGAAAH